MNAHGLTRREMQVLCLLCEGKNYAQIAQECTLAEITVHHYVHKVKQVLVPDDVWKWTDDQLRRYARVYILPCYE